MALKSIMLRKKITDAKKALDALRAAAADFETRRADLEKRESEIVTAIEEASTDEERAAVEEMADQFDQDKTAFESEVKENTEKIDRSRRRRPTR